MRSKAMLLQSMVRYGIGTEYCLELNGGGLLKVNENTNKTITVLLITAHSP